MNLDDTIFIMKHPTRRGIIQRLVNEPHYCHQLGTEMKVSDQLIKKHLLIMEKKGLVVSVTGPSENGGPPADYWFLVKNINLRIDFTSTFLQTSLAVVDK